MSVAFSSVSQICMELAGKFSGISSACAAFQSGFSVRAKMHRWRSPARTIYVVT